ncbi:CHASE domain-containing protein [Granulosicoccus antarcticus]|uniref:histidine kinase n=1 Tax=Granulosicoccus antarcticus IMCC3135 TaxID=1192854 RepID=A0A2Z2P1T7_9GAMM|nr:CHASE domain-containing protein [Granulosicoccus antarcticus]ASJ76521.1 Phytochrome-like protein cph1 [Granulosicoccus antarcticus IMCC3135]
MTAASHTESPIRAGPTFDLELFKSQQAKLRHHAKLNWIHWFILGLSLAITVFAWKTSESALIKRDQIRFEREAERAVSMMQERIRHYEDALLSGVAAMQTHDGVMTREEWRNYSEFLQLNERYPGINGIGVIHYVDTQELPRFIARIRKTVPDFTIFPEHEFDLSMPITFVEPEATNKSALGLDVAFELNRRTAALKARLTGTTQISGPITLVQDQTKTAGFLFYAPYYEGNATESRAWNALEREEHFRGLIYAPLIVRNLVQGVLKTEDPLVNIILYDQETVLYNDETLARTDKPTFTMEEEVRMNGRIWTFNITSTPAFELGSVTDQPVLVLLSGLCLDIMLLGLFLVMSRSNRHVLVLAEEMTDNLSNQTRQLQENNRDLESFAHIVSHDLKTPIRNIYSLTQILEDDLSEYIASNDSNTDIRHRLDSLRDQATRSQSLITGILEYSVLDNQEAPSALVNTREMVTTIGTQLSLGDHQFTLQGDFPTLHTNGILLEQVLTNLVDNAVKYNNTQNTPTVEISITENDDFYQFSVSDNGPGIAERFHQRIFKPFTTLESITDIHSSGIGLSIVQRAVERQGGQIEVISPDNSGSTFRFTWPKTDDAANSNHGRRYA